MIPGIFTTGGIKVIIIIHLPSTFVFNLRDLYYRGYKNKNNNNSKDNNDNYTVMQKKHATKLLSTSLLKG